MEERKLNNVEMIYNHYTENDLETLFETIINAF